MASFGDVGKHPAPHATLQLAVINGSGPCSGAILDFGTVGLCDSRLAQVDGAGCEGSVLTAVAPRPVYRVIGVGELPAVDKCVDGGLANGSLVGQVGSPLVTLPHLMVAVWPSMVQVT